MPCKLCLEERPLQNSHVLPELLFRRAYDSLHRAREFTLEPHRQRHIQQGYREALLCTKCEGHIGRYEKYFADVWFNHALRPVSVSASVRTITGLNYRFFKLFHLSLLWRAGVSQRSEFREVRLGPHEERLRRMLIADDPGPPHAYPFWGQFLVDPRDGKILDDVILEPGFSRPAGHTVYTFVFGGCAWYYFASSHTGDRPLPIVFGPEGELVMHATSIFNFEPLVQSFVMFKARDRRAP